MLSLAVLLQDDGLTFGEVVRNLPHDAGAVLVYALIAAFLYFIWWGSRNTGEPPTGG